MRGTSAQPVRSMMVENGKALIAPFAVAALSLVTGCGPGLSTTPDAMSATGLHGTLHGGQQPIAGATMQLYAVGTSTDGGAATPLLTKMVTTDQAGGFNLTNLYSCTGVSQVYLTATGGNTGSGINPNGAEMVALGDCTATQQLNFIQMNELTTIAATSALEPYMTSPTAVGSTSAHAAALKAAFGLASEYVDPTTGQAPGIGVPSGYSDPVALVYTEGDVLAACINTAGGMGSGTNCGTLFANTTNNGTTPADTITAALYMAKNPTANLTTLYQLATPASPYQSTLSAAPASWQLALVPTSAAIARTFVVEPDAGISQFYALVNNAQRTIDMTMYELVDTMFSGDLVAACNRGVKVRVILDQNDEMSSNTAVYNQINAVTNCQAMWANPQFSVTHQKSFIVDGTQVAILTLNLTSRYYTGTRDFGLIENDPADIAAVQATFNTDYGSTTDKSYQPAAGDDLIWSPTTATASLLSVINNATTTLLVENEEMSASNIVTALENACKRGVQVQITQTDDSTYHTNWSNLEAAGCGVHIYPDTSKYIYIHAKVMLADYGLSTARAYMGSINFSTNSLTLNRELGLFLADPGIFQTIYTTLTNDYNGAAAY